MSILSNLFVRNRFKNTKPDPEPDPEPVPIRKGQVKECPKINSRVIIESKSKVGGCERSFQDGMVVDTARCDPNHTPNWYIKVRFVDSDGKVRYCWEHPFTVMAVVDDKTDWENIGVEK